MISGFIDLQVNGYRGTNFSSREFPEEQFAEASRGGLASGTAGFPATLVTSPTGVYARNLPMLARLADGEEFENRLLGFEEGKGFVVGRTR